MMNSLGNSLTFLKKSTTSEECLMEMMIRSSLIELPIYFIMLCRYLNLKTNSSFMIVSVEMVCWFNNNGVRSVDSIAFSWFLFVYVTWLSSFILWLLLTSYIHQAVFLASDDRGNLGFVILWLYIISLVLTGNENSRMSNIWSKRVGRGLQGTRYFHSIFLNQGLSYTC